MSEKKRAKRFDCAAFCPECLQEERRCDEDRRCLASGATLIMVYGTVAQRAETMEAIKDELESRAAARSAT